MVMIGWRDATQTALYGPGGFFRQPVGPAGHFRTSVHASPQFAAALLELVRQVDQGLGRPAELVVTDVGAGRGELLLALGERAGAHCPELAARLRLRAVELADRPDGLPQWIGWSDRIEPAVAGVLIANEWLDNVPVDVAEADEDGVVRLVLVDPATGEERLGEPVRGDRALWLERWWPLSGGPGPGAAAGAGAGAGAEPGFRAEIGLPRDLAWAAAVGSLGRGVAIAVDYAHRAGRRPPFGSLAAFRDGREVRPVPDGSCDLTSHVALDSCLAAAVSAHGDRIVHSLWTTQREALRLLGVDGARPPLALASSDPAGYVRALAAAGQAAELTDPGGLGSFVWAVQSVGTAALPEAWLGLGDGRLWDHDEEHAGQHADE
jgi:SAM-dependent MidA family methyltransferase